MTTAELNKLMLTLHHMEESQLRHLNDGIIAELKQLMAKNAAPAQRQQVECQECERLRSEIEVVTAQRDAAQTSIGGLQVIIDDQCDELSALKAQQVGQEPAGEVHLRTGGGISLLHVELAQPLPPGTKLYSVPQPAPAQPAAQDHGEVQRLREALSRIRDHAARIMDDEVFYEADNALSTITEEETEK